MCAFFWARAGVASIWVAVCVSVCVHVYVWTCGFVGVCVGYVCSLFVCLLFIRGHWEVCERQAGLLVSKQS